MPLKDLVIRSIFTTEQPLSPHRRDFKAEYDVQRTDHGRRDRLLFREIQKPALVPGRLNLVLFFSVIFKQLEPPEVLQRLLPSHPNGITASFLSTSCHMFHMAQPGQAHKDGQTIPDKAKSGKSKWKRLSLSCLFLVLLGRGRSFLFNYGELKLDLGLPCIGLVLCEVLEGGVLSLSHTLSLAEHISSLFLGEFSSFVGRVQPGQAVPQALAVSSF